MTRSLAASFLTVLIPSLIGINCVGNADVCQWEVLVYLSLSGFDGPAEAEDIIEWD